MQSAYRKTEVTELAFYDTSFLIDAISESRAPGQRGGEYIDGYLISLTRSDGDRLQVKLRRDDKLLGALLYMFYQPKGSKRVRFAFDAAGEKVLASGVVA